MAHVGNDRTLRNNSTWAMSNGSRVNCGRPLTGARSLDERPHPPGRKHSLPLRREAPVSFKRMLGSAEH
jgi:hypothetical protein